MPIMPLKLSVPLTFLHLLCMLLHSIKKGQCKRELNIKTTFVHMLFCAVLCDTHHGPNRILHFGLTFCSLFWKGKSTGCEISPGDGFNKMSSI